MYAGGVLISMVQNKEWRYALSWSRPGVIPVYRCCSLESLLLIYIQTLWKLAACLFDPPLDPVHFLTRMSDKPKVLVVCLGNICRSPMGEAVLAHVAKERGIDMHVESAGTAGYHVGEEPDERLVHIIGSQMASVANPYPKERLLSARRCDLIH